VGLKEVAKEAGISHGLVTHYFGTYATLVEETFAFHIQRVRQQVLERISVTPDLSPKELISIVADQYSKGPHLKLAAWAYLSGRLHSETFLPVQQGGLRRVLEALRFKRQLEGGPVPSMQRMEFVILLVITSLAGYFLARSALWMALGKKVSSARDRWFVESLATLVELLSRTEGFLDDENAP
jgi:AcrR family transcriptional regulator